jgi:hypothetical protein
MAAWIQQDTAIPRFLPDNIHAIVEKVVKAIIQVLALLG